MRVNVPVIFQENLTDSKNLSGKPVDIKLHNQRLVISLLERKKILSAGELSSLTALSKTTVSKILAELCKQDIVCSAGKGESTTEGGKKPELFRINAGLAVTVVLSMQRRNVLDCAVIDLGREILYREKYTLADGLAYPALTQKMRETLTSVHECGALSGKRVCGVAVAYNGVVNRDRGEILYPPQSAHASFYPIRRDLSGLFSAEIPISINNACHYAGYAELLFENNANVEKLGIISCGESVSGCLLTNQQMLPGCGGVVGEFGHLIVDPRADTRCYCGCRGCIESLISERAIVASAGAMSHSFPFSSVARKAQEQELCVETLLQAAFGHDFFAQEVLTPVIQYLAIMIRSISCLNDVSKVIIQGMYARAGEDFLEMIREELRKYNRLALHSEPTVEFSQYSVKGEEEDEYACICGAGYAVSNLYLDAQIGRAEN